MIKLEKIKGEMLLDDIAIGSPSAWIKIAVPGKEQILILDNSYTELPMFEGRAKDKDNPYHFADPVTDFLDPNKYELISIPEGPALCIYGYTYGWKRLQELSGKYYVYKNLDVAEGEAGLVFVRCWCDTSRFYGNDKLAKFADDERISPVSGGLIIGSPAAWFFINGLGIKDFNLENPQIQILGFTEAGAHEKAQELLADGYELLRSIEGPNIGLYGMDEYGKVHLICHIEGEFLTLLKKDEPEVVFIQNRSRKTYVQYTGSEKLTEALSAAGYALSLD